MSIETAIVIGLDNEPIYIHLPPGRSAVSIPDSRDLWDVLWSNRDNLLGVAHSHPGSGIPCPSWEDITTFSACEAALGKKLSWWICSSDHVRLFKYHGETQYNYQSMWFSDEVEKVWHYAWLNKLRELSYGVKND